MKHSAALVAVAAAMTAALVTGAPAVAAPASSCLPGGVYAFVANSDNPQGRNTSLAVLDTASHKVVRTTTGLGENPSSVAVTADGAKAYVANFGAVNAAPDGPPQTVSVIDNRSGDVAHEVTVGRAPVQVALSPDGRYAYVVNSGTLQDEGSVTVIDTGNDEAVATITDGLHNPAGIAFAPDGAHAYVTNEQSGTLAVLDTATRTVSASVELGPQGAYPVGVAVAPDGKRVYVAANLSGDVIVVDPSSASLVGPPVQLPGGGMPYGIAVTPDGSRLYVTEAATDQVAVVDTATATALPRTITVGRNPTAVAFTPDGRQAYVTSSLDDPRGVSVIDTAARAVADSVNTGSGPFAVALAAIPAAAGCRS
ncbi:beta-propeller fold lactonase family protein [Kitasatospora mediocidica]|uniref:beta-propeller fold lactonase family protein n=1 Tax=Kitasatospora mediocidica TaxID=58352 RepID=UPI000691AFDB|nr:beta-propeller fold lactonase family protein [Kitasatospora mediocidica]